MFHLLQSPGVAASQVENHPSSIICKVCEDAVEGCADEEDHSGFPMHSEWYFNPSKSCTELEQDQDHVDKPKD